MFPFRFSPLALFLAALLCLPAVARAQNTTTGTATGPAAGGAQAYTTIRGVDVRPLSNGLQITVRADGILQYRNADLNGQRMNISFPGARNGTGKNFFNIDRYPVSYIQISTPREVTNGIGLNMEIRNFSSPSATVAATPDGQGVLFTIQSDRTVERRGGAGAPGGGNAGAGANGGNENGDGAANGAAADDAAQKPDTSTEVRFENGLISLRAVRAGIHELMSAIAQKSGLSIAVDDAMTSPARARSVSACKTWSRRRPSPALRRRRAWRCRASTAST